jgi:hypothetical protein
MLSVLRLTEMMLIKIKHFLNLYALVKVCLQFASLQTGRITAIFIIVVGSGVRRNMLSPSEVNHKYRACGLRLEKTVFFSQTHSCQGFFTGGFAPSVNIGLRSQDKCDRPKFYHRERSPSSSWEGPIFGRKGAIDIQSRCRRSFA